MRKKQRRFTNRDARLSLSRLTSDMFLSAAREQDIHRHFGIFVAYADTSTLLPGLTKLSTKKRVSELICSPAPTLQQLGKTPILRLRNTERLIQYYRAQFSLQRAQLVSFVTLARKCERILLAGQYEEANELLGAILARFGYSLWYIRTTLLLLASQGQVASTQEFADHCRAGVEDPFFGFLVNSSLLLASDPLLHLKKVIGSNTRELREAGEDTWADLISLLLALPPSTTGTNALECLEELQVLPLVDRYIFVSRLLAFNEAQGSRQAQGDAGSRLRALIDEIDREAMESPTTSPERIIESYERGEYADVLQQLSTLSLEGDVTPYLNLAAKSVQLSKCGPWQPNTPLGELVDAIASFYDFTSVQKRAEEACRAKIILCTHLFCAPQIQICLYKAMPHRFSPGEKSIAACVASQLASAQTPMCALLRAGKDPILDNSYRLAGSALTTERHLKQSIRNAAAVPSAASLGAMILAVSEYGAAAPLMRDYYELAASVYLRMEAYAELIALCGDSITALPQSYTAFPLAQLADYIEANRTASLDAVLIVDTYTRNFDTDRDNLLHETFEDYLKAEGATRPSELAERRTIDEKLALLLRNVCTLDTMDYLGCFQTSVELRAERVRLLDILRDAEHIDSEHHRTEVDEIIEQVIVDAAATGFNVAKIDVDEAAIARRIRDEVASIFTLYKSMEQESDQKIVDVEWGAGSPAARAVIAGDRNTTLLKIFSTVLDALINDEKHGLDKNLSGEIRHGFFSNLIHSKLEDSHLLVEADEDGAYSQNTYWLSAHTLIPHELLLSLNASLGWFSTELDALVGKAEEWMKVSRSLKDDRAFRFYSSPEDFDELQSVADNTTRPEDVVDNCVAFFWRKTEDALSTMRNRLHEDFAREVDSLFSSLLQKVDEQRGNIALADLRAAINQARAGIREDIATAAEWFRRSERYSVRPHSLSNILKIALECFARVRGTTLNATQSGDATIGAISFDGHLVKPMIVALVNLFENCVRHSGLGYATTVHLAAEATHLGWIVSIENALTAERAMQLTGSALAEIRMRISAPTYSGLVSSEGRSGLRKVSNQLAAVDERIKLSIDVNGQNFRATVTYDASSSPGRGQ